MAKGWSFGGLVAALKSAAFLNAGASRGEVVTVGQKNLQIPTTAFSRGFNFNTYTFVNNEVLYVEMNSATNIPPELAHWDLGNTNGAYVILTVLGVTDQSFATILVSHGNALRPPILYYSTGPSGSRTYTAAPVMTCKEAGNLNINLLVNSSDVGVYYQNSDTAAASAGGYPAAEAGTLEVIPAAYAVQQRYTTIYGRVFIRSRIGPSNDWITWKEVARTQMRGESLEFGNIELYSGTPYIDFHLNNSGADFTARVIADSPNSLIVTGESQNTFKFRNTGQFRGSTWGRGWGQESDGNVPYGSYDNQIATGSWTPLATLHQSIPGVGYASWTSFGSLVETAGFAQPCIFRYGDNGSRCTWVFRGDGNIDYFGDGDGGGKRFATEAWTSAAFVMDIRLASFQEAQVWRGYGYRDESGWVITSVFNQTADEYIDYVGRRKLQKYVGGVWYDSYSV